MENFLENISYACRLCPDIRNGLGPYEVAKTNQLKNHMIRIHGVDEIQTNWNRYFNACKKLRIEKAPTVVNIGSNIGFGKV